MRFYGKLALMVLLPCAGQATLSSGVAADAYFAMRCLAASTSGDYALERRLVGECEEKLVAERQGVFTTIAFHAATAR